MVDGDRCKTCLPGEVFLLLVAKKPQHIIKALASRWNYNRENNASVKKPYSKGKLPRST